MLYPVKTELILFHSSTSQAVVLFTCTCSKLKGKKRKKKQSRNFDGAKVQTDTQVSQGSQFQRLSPEVVQATILYMG